MEPSADVIVAAREQGGRVVLAKTQLVEDGMVNEIIARKITTFLG